MPAKAKEKNWVQERGFLAFHLPSHRMNVGEFWPNYFPGRGVKRRKNDKNERRLKERSKLRPTERRYFISQSLALHITIYNYYMEGAKIYRWIYWLLWLWIYKGKMINVAFGLLLYLLYLLLYLFIYTSIFWKLKSFAKMLWLKRKCFYINWKISLENDFEI